ncbi:50S ribosomal protein L6 [Candidatus Curtissbacteria bacterium RIFCSPLOWO2_01_FULL_39_62]|uniref:Large ribosomal subunit protein uL6 n=1 Tax=Candidatus Curtissbacteria bacterium RIFCSPHIGHO2_02_FULL_40_16b TaxID=1797714 RepID=A0A1F5G7G8_9BACT|nr:MAG: 50S ribosomal protein L6 [Candidatus Curtissbacteria bacterium RIFCSPHIGHO2_01_FULL_39_57]OGD87816.1 MAG: 50S ribosomal protein L6 [Candidatus Curtissbacteria bacterium RIFCSPHIGHO2_02_FULL_40_16b]OGD90569.1 MAG: 50S ribosomal protein L6 [Candidatus Curtissbacteria bacterium RIFCSPHIGHO2_12_FULL_38_37]OGD99814.1 MAG: 50S ribosomal protein L6 [Candidatus Curtissbacteria bacterium RIFCSPLOWO2_02_FULL_40_11]OGE01080.1 MAG: 50S ribosomal protein L6 [Candidatus Curtissbacteria bacterium RIFC
MSKIGNLPIETPEGVTVSVIDNIIKVSGSKGELSFSFRPEIKVETDGKEIKVSRRNDSKFVKSLHGLTRSLIANMIMGVTEGHSKKLELVGVGYRASKQGENLVLNVGYSHPVVIESITGIQLDTKENKITVSGADKALVGEIAATIRRVRPPEPYKGKGIKYVDEVIRRKAGKALKSAQGAA